MSSDKDNINLIVAYYTRLLHGYYKFCVIYTLRPNKISKICTNRLISDLCFIIFMANLKLLPLLHWFQN